MSSLGTMTNNSILLTEGVSPWSSNTPYGVVGYPMYATSFPSIDTKKHVGHSGLCFEHQTCHGCKQIPEGRYSDLSEVSLRTRAMSMEEARRAYPEYEGDTVGTGLLHQYRLPTHNLPRGYTQPIDFNIPDSHRISASSLHINGAIRVQGPEWQQIGDTQIRIRVPVRLNDNITVRYYEA